MATFFNHQRISQRAVQTTQEKRGPIDSRGEPIPEFQWKHIATCDYPGGPESCTHLDPALNHIIKLLKINPALNHIIKLLKIIIFNWNRYMHYLAKSHLGLNCPTLFSYRGARHTYIKGEFHPTIILHRGSAHAQNFINFCKKIVYHMSVIFVGYFIHLFKILR